MTKEGEEDHIFFLAEAFIPDVIAGAIYPLAFDENNHSDGAEENDAPVLLSVCTSNLHLEDMVELRRQ